MPADGDRLPALAGLLAGPHEIITGRHRVLRRTAQSVESRVTLRHFAPAARDVLHHVAGVLLGAAQRAGGDVDGAESAPREPGPGLAVAPLDRQVGLGLTDRSDGTLPVAAPEQVVGALQQCRVGLPRARNGAG